MPMQKETFLYAYSVKMRMQINLFDMCFVRIRANHHPAGLDVGQCCDSFAKTRAELDRRRRRRRRRRQQYFEHDDNDNDNDSDSGNGNNARVVAAASAADDDIYDKVYGVLVTICQAKRAADVKVAATDDAHRDGGRRDGRRRRDEIGGDGQVGRVTDGGRELHAFLARASASGSLTVLKLSPGGGGGGGGGSCGASCKRMDDAYESLARDRPAVFFLELDVRASAANAQLAREVGAQRFPAFHLYLGQRRGHLPHHSHMHACALRSGFHRVCFFFLLWLFRLLFFI